MRVNQAFRYISKQFTPLLVGFLLTSGFMGNSNSETDYWAYQPVELPALPTVKNSDWIKNPIDAFILSRLEKANLSPAKPASKQALIRRVYYDLTGLPPSPQAVENFLNTTDPQAYEKLIDQLLDSEQYGEKWGRHWLDLVRYAETNGYERDSNKPFAWRYRDYVIESFNKDKPYDQFIREQLAGDLLDQPTAETITATGFYRLGIWDDEPADRRLARYDYLDDIVSTTGQVMLGIPMGCVRCHDHKADPISIEDYYSFLAFFHDIAPHSNSPLADIGTPEQKQIYKAKVEEKKLTQEKLQDQIFKHEEELKQIFAPNESDIDSTQTNLVNLEYRFFRHTWDALPKDFDQLKPETQGEIATNRFSLRPASRQKAIGLVFEGQLRVPTNGKYTFYLDSIGGSRLWVDGKKVTELETSKGGCHQGAISLNSGYVPIRLDYFNRNQESPYLRVYWSKTGSAKKYLSDEVIILPDARSQGQIWAYTFEQPNSDWFKSEFDHTEWAVGAGGFGTNSTPNAVVRTKWNTSGIWMRKKIELDKLPKQIELNIHHDEEAQVYVNGTKILHRRGHVTHYQRQLLKSNQRSPFRVGNNIIAVHCSQTGGGQYIDIGLVAKPIHVKFDDLLRKYAKEIESADDLQKKVEAYHQVRKKRDDMRKNKIPYPYMALAVEDKGVSEVHILRRGNPQLVGDQVAPAVPAILKRGKEIEIEHPSTKRRVIADWIASSENPLTSRVIVNRIWQHHFGRGLVRSSNDFGQFGQKPTHPDLLDWLAHQLVLSQWKLKSLHRIIMTSNAYKMSAQRNEHAMISDPLNDLFWRFDMRRLSAEEIRDSVLSVAGNLNLKQGGPSIFPELPEEVLATSSQPNRVWGYSPPEEANRRSIYVKVKRSLLVPILNQFDMADTDSTCAVRFVTTVPTQSLTMLNGKFINQQAQDFARRIRQHGGSTLTQQLKYGLELVLSRQPSNEEIHWANGFIETLVNDEQVKLDIALDRFALLALNLNEFIFLD